MAPRAGAFTRSGECGRRMTGAENMLADTLPGSRSREGERRGDSQKRVQSQEGVWFAVFLR